MPVFFFSLFRHRILQDAVFLATDSPQTGGILTVNKRGLVCLCNVNLQTLIPYISQALVNVPNRQQVASSLAKRYGLPGSEETLMQVKVTHRGRFFFSSLPAWPGVGCSSSFPKSGCICLSVCPFAKVHIYTGAQVCMYSSTPAGARHPCMHAGCA